MSLTFSIGALLNKPAGSQEQFEINEPFSLGSDGPPLTSNVTASLNLIKLPHEISAELVNIRTTANTRCSRCLKDIEFVFSIPSAEREFFIDMQEDNIDPGEAFFLVDRGRSKIDVTDMMKEELLLHFPAVPVCFDGCKGLCDRCGINRNEKTCSCTHESAPRISPFKFIHNP